MSLSFRVVQESRLRSIDALRGAAALAVVVYHALGHPPSLDSTGIWLTLEQGLRYICSFGYTGVYLFFVISGFCIHLQWAKSRASGRDYQINFLPFWQRRLRRLYPAYLCAILLYLGVVVIRGELHFTREFGLDLGLHVTLLHNLTTKTVYGINSAFWTLAIEEQLYLAYFLLLFLRARLGWGGTLICALAARILWYLGCSYLRDNYQIAIPIGESAASHWFTWSLGAIAVEASVGLAKLPRWSSNIWIAIALLLSAVGWTHMLPMISNATLHDWGWLALDPLWGSGFFVLVNYFVQAERGWQLRAKLPDLIKWLAAIGLFSYSLYLTHQFVLLHAYLIHIIKLPPFFFSLLVLTPLAVGFAWLFFQLCEKPFLKAKS